MSGTYENSQVISLSDNDEDDNEPGQIEVAEILRRATTGDDRKLVQKLAKVLSRSSETLSEVKKIEEEAVKKSRGKKSTSSARSSSASKVASELAKREPEPPKRTRGLPKKDNLDIEKQKIDDASVKADDEMNEVDLSDEIRTDGSEKPTTIKIKNGIFLEHKKWAHGRWYVGIRKVGTSGYDQWINFTDSFEKLHKAVKIMRANLSGNVSSSDSD